MPPGKGNLQSRLQALRQQTRWWRRLAATAGWQARQAGRTISHCRWLVHALWVLRCNDETRRQAISIPSAPALTHPAPSLHPWHLAGPLLLVTHPHPPRTHLHLRHLAEPLLLLPLLLGGAAVAAAAAAAWALLRPACHHRCGALQPGTHDGAGQPPLHWGGVGWGGVGV